MYYHNSPTTKQVKLLKASRAEEMKHHLEAMKQVSAKYDPTILKLETLRKQELYIENERSAGRLSSTQLEHAHATIASNRVKAKRMVTKLTEVE